MEKFRELLFLKNLKGIGKKKIYTKYWDVLKTVQDIEELKNIVRHKETKLSKADIEDGLLKSEKIYNSVINDKDIDIITVFDKDYPLKLNVMENNRPLILYAKGDINALKKENISIIGTRNPSEWSVKVERNLVQAILQVYDRAVVSGLALGCDTIAHETTVKQQRTTIAVLPSGVRMITPAVNKKLAEEIINNKGCLISEYEPDVKAYKSYYVERDAIVAAISDINFVVECDVKSGTMHTVDAAKRYMKRLGCYIPSDMSKGKYAGNDYMIKNKGALKVSDTDDLNILFESEDRHSCEKKIRYQQLSLEEFLENPSSSNC